MSALARRRALSAAAATLAGILLLAGCAGIPTSGDVGTQAIDEDDGSGGLVTLAEGPQPGDTQEELLLGFLRAQRAPKGDYQVARDFLTDEFRTVWSPTAGVIITDTPLAPTAVDDTSIAMTVRIDAVVNASGNYSDLTDPQTETLQYAFAKNADGEWRIAAAPDGTVLPSGRFTTAFAATSLYFFDPSGDYLVPDVRWFPDTASRADRIVTELLKGQSAWYAEGVLLTAFPSGTELEGITVANGQTSVDLSGDIAAQSASARWRMQQQLQWSLATLADSGNVEMTVGGFPVQVAEGTTPDRVLAVSAKTLGFAEGNFGFVSGGSVERIPGLSSRVEGLAPLGATLSRDGSSVAVRAADGAWLVRESVDAVLVDSRAGLIDPGIDDLGYVWTVPADAPESIVAVAADGVPHPISAPYLDGTVRSLAVSRDGARLLVATQTADGPAVWMIGIVRNADGVPASLGAPLLLAVDDAPLLDAAWVDASTIATLSGSGGDARVDLYRIGGRHEAFGAIAQGVQLVGGNTADGVRVRDADGVLWRRTSSGGWQSTGVIASFLATQQ